MISPTTQVCAIAKYPVAAASVILLTKHFSILFQIVQHLSTQGGKFSWTNCLQRGRIGEWKTFSSSYLWRTSQHWCIPSPTRCNWDHPVVLLYSGLLDALRRASCNLDQDKFWWIQRLRMSCGAVFCESGVYDSPVAHRWVPHVSFDQIYCHVMWDVLKVANIWKKKKKKNSKAQIFYSVI